MRTIIAGCLTIVCLHGLFPVAEAQVNIENRRWHTDENAIHATVDIGLTLKRGNSEVSNYKASGTVGKRQGAHLAFLLGKIEYGTTRDEKYLNHGQGHLRYNYYLSEFLALEGFTQVEYDEFRLLNLRALGGGGVRWMASTADTSGQRISLNGAWGIAVFYEQERYDLPEGHPGRETDIVRLSSYLTGGLQVSDNARLALTVYGQPRAGDWADVRSIGESALEVELSRLLSLLVKLTSRYDSEPVGEVEEWDLSLENTLRFRW
ncbi:DUF481 domain-containing protein [bacterium]|nr:DUF481 domain-containing protein [bacterium]